MFVILLNAVNCKWLVGLFIFWCACSSWRHPSMSNCLANVYQKFLVHRSGFYPNRQSLSTRHRGQMFNSGWDRFLFCLHVSCAHGENEWRPRRKSFEVANLRIREEAELIEYIDSLVSEGIIYFDRQIDINCIAAKAARSKVVMNGR